VLSGFGALLALWPVGILAALYAYAIRARLAGGFWPQTHNPHSYNLGPNAHYDAHYMFLRPWILMAPIELGSGRPSPWTGLALLIPAAIYTTEFAAALGATSRRLPLPLVSNVAASALINFVWWFADPGGVIDWFQD